MFFANIFGIKNSIEEYTDTFESPSNWQPCEEIDKTAVAKNKNASETLKVIAEKISSGESLVIYDKVLKE